MSAITGRSRKAGVRLGARGHVSRKAPENNLGAFGSVCPPFLSALRGRRMATLWRSQVLSALGDHLYGIAVIWLAAQLAGSGTGLVAAAEAGSALAFGLLGGVYADRWNRRDAMVAADVIRAGAVLALPVLALFGTLALWQLVAVALVLGALGALFDPALQASLPVLASDGRMLQAANGLMDMTQRLARATGPSLTGLLVAALPLIHFFTLAAVTFAVSAAAILSLGRHVAWKPAREVAAAGKGGIRGVVVEMVGAVRLVHEHPTSGGASSRARSSTPYGASPSPSASPSSRAACSTTEWAPTD